MVSEQKCRIALASFEKEIASHTSSGCPDFVDILTFSVIFSVF